MEDDIFLLTYRFGLTNSFIHFEKGETINGKYYVLIGQFNNQVEEVIMLIHKNFHTFNFFVRKFLGVETKFVSNPGKSTTVLGPLRYILPIANNPITEENLISRFADETVIMLINGT